MGQGLPKAVTPIVVKRQKGGLFRIGFAEMNGWRPNMEDAHVIFPRDGWGFFGVFDGHGGDQCSAFIARRMEEELKLAAGPPADDAALKALSLRLDREYLDTKQPSGSTGTFVIVQSQTAEEQVAVNKDASCSSGDAKEAAAVVPQYCLRVGNVGDSRVLLGRLEDGAIIEGSGTDGGLTTDHKPDHADERARIERTGGRVESVMGVARVNGDLAVSRAFGDAQFKETGGPAQEDHPVSADPELTTLSCCESNFLMLVCDGISEGNFPNREVISLAAEELRKGGDRPDPGAAAAEVCRRALECNSKDNLSCMIVLLGSGEMAGAEQEYLPGPFDAPDHAGFRKAYANMARHAGLSLAQAVERRYDDARRELKAADSDSANHAALQGELTAFGEGPPLALKVESAERVAWFEQWLEEQAPNSSNPANDLMNMPREQIMQILERNPHLMPLAKQQGLLKDDIVRKVRVAPLQDLRLAVEAHPALKWDDRMEKFGGKDAVVIQDDLSDGTSRVRFPQFHAVAWLPTCALSDDGEEEEEIQDGRLVRAAELKLLRPAVEAHASLQWFPALDACAGAMGSVMKEDTDGTSQVLFSAAVAPPNGVTVWLPTDMLTDVTDASADAGDSRQPEGPRVAPPEPQRVAEVSKPDGAQLDSEKGDAEPTGTSDASTNAEGTEEPPAKVQRVAE